MKATTPLPGGQVDWVRRGEHPRPQLQRPGWETLDGQWDFAFHREAAWARPEHVSWAASVRVPFAPETEASGIGDPTFSRACWYRRTVETPQLTGGERLLLHFAAVDHAATVRLGARRPPARGERRSRPARGPREVRHDGITPALYDAMKKPTAISRGGLPLP